MVSTDSSGGIPIGKVACARLVIVDKRGNVLRRECMSCGMRVTLTTQTCPSCAHTLLGYMTKMEA